MKVIKITAYLSDFFADLSNKARQQAMKKVEDQRDKARKHNMDALNALAKAWDDEVGRHNDNLRALRQARKEHENKVKLKHEELESKTKDIQLA